MKEATGTDRFCESLSTDDGQVRRNLPSPPKGIVSRNSPPRHRLHQSSILALVLSAFLPFMTPGFAAFGQPTPPVPPSSGAPPSLDAEIQRWTQERQRYRQAKDTAREMQTLLQLGAALVTTERHQEAIAVLQDALTLTRQLQKSAAEAQVLGNLGIAYQAVGNYANAITTHRQAGKLMLQLGDRQGLGQVLSNLGNTFAAVGDYSNATIAFQQSLKIAQQRRDHEGEIVALGNLGTLAANQGQDKESLQFFQQSLALAQAQNYLPGQASALLNLGSTHHAMGQLNQARDFYQSSLQLARQLGDRQREARALGALGLVYEDQNDLAQAIQHQEQSLAIGRSLNNPELQGQALNNLGHALFTAGRLQEAESTLQGAIKLLDGLRSDLSDRYQVALFDTQLHTYSLLQQVFVAAKKYDEALEAAEWGRARAFAEQVARHLRSGATKQQATPERGQLIRLADIRRIAKEQNATLVEYAIVPDDAFKFRGKQRAREKTLYIWVVQPSGTLHFRQVDLQPLWQENLQLATLVSTGHQCLSPALRCTLAAPSDARSASQSPQESPAPAPPSSPRRRVNPGMHRLYQLLIAPIADLLPKNASDRVIILPLEALYLVPFPALQRADGQYLIEQHTLLTAPAIQVLDLTRQLNAQRQRGNQNLRDRLLPALIVGNPTMPTVGAAPLSPLPASEVEAQYIAELLKTKALIGNQATQPLVVQQMAQASVIHLATHGLLEFGQNLDDTAIPGAIALAPTPNASPRPVPNGILTASEILDLRLKANLVVLSACDTGRGKITGDGVQGLSRAFIAAGVPSVVVSLWAVSDASTAHLMVNFYQNLLQQPDKAQALRAAMLDTMQRYPAPLDWAAFTLMGESE